MKALVITLSLLGSTTAFATPSLRDYANANGHIGELVKAVQAATDTLCDIDNTIDSYPEGKAGTKTTVEAMCTSRGEEGYATLGITFINRSSSTGQAIVGDVTAISFNWPALMEVKGHKNMQLSVLLLAGAVGGATKTSCKPGSTAPEQITFRCSDQDGATNLVVNFAKSGYNLVKIEFKRLN